VSAVDGIDEFAAKLAGILKEKNAAYGDSFARVPTILETLFPDVPPETLGNILFFARIFDKAGRITQDPLGAGEDAFLDLAGYALLQANVQRLKREARTKTPAMQREALLKTIAEPSTNDSPTVDEVKDGFEGSGRIKRDVWPFVTVHTSATGWYLKHTGWGDKLFNTYGGGCWYPDERDATAFPSYEAALAYLRKQGELNAGVPGAEKGGAK